jgi:hypothetical protein
MRENFINIPFSLRRVSHRGLCVSPIQTVFIWQPASQITDTLICSIAESLPETLRKEKAPTKEFLYGPGVTTAAIGINGRSVLLPFTVTSINALNAPSIHLFYNEKNLYCLIIYGYSFRM